MMRLLYELDSGLINPHHNYKETLEYAINLFPSLQDLKAQGKTIELKEVLRDSGHDNKPCWTLYLECN